MYSRTKVSSFYRVVCSFLSALLCTAPIALANEIVSFKGDCQAIPKFVKARSIANPIFSTSDRFRTGMTIQEQGRSSILQLPSWTRFGRLGPMLIIETGDIFVLPVPSVNTLANPFSQQNSLLKVDSETGILQEFFSFPVAQQPSQSNPFGLLGLAYDCETHVVYLSTVSGSNFDKEAGKVFAFDANTKTILASLENIDVIGLGVFTFYGRKFLLMGSARNSEVVSVELQKDGSFASKNIRHEFMLDQTNELRVRKFSQDKNDSGSILIHTTEFYYNLLAQSEFRQLKITYQLEDKKWIPMHVSGAEVLEMKVP